jgi:hypothetical protein
MTRKSQFLGFAATSVAAIVLAAVTGCGSSSPRPADPAAARDALDRALTAWKDGKTSESLKETDPPIVVSDHLWKNGSRLMKYQIEPGDRSQGADQVFRVVLWLEAQKAKSKEKQEKTEYRVGTNPILTVNRGFY